MKHGAYFFVFVCLFLLFVIVIFSVYTGFDKPNVSCEIFLCVRATALCRFSFLLPSFNVIALSFTGCSTERKPAFGFSSVWCF